jgi:hypothetical protein
MEHNLHTGNYKSPGDLTGVDSQYTRVRVHQSCGARSHAATPPTEQTQSAAVTSVEWRRERHVICSGNVPTSGLACPKKTGKGVMHSPPGVDNCVIDGKSQSG